MNGNKKNDAIEITQDVPSQILPQDNIGFKEDDTIGFQEDNKCNKKEVNILLANLVFLFHTIVIVFILLAPFSNIPAILILHVTFSISLILHWWFNSNECSLTYIESKLRGLHRTESFTYKFISPIYDISSTEWSKMCYIITIFLLCVSIYYLYNSERVSRAFSCYNKLSDDPEYSSKSFYQKSFVVFNCFKDLLIWC